jgi:zinc protease
MKKIFSLIKTRCFAPLLIIALIAACATQADSRIYNSAGNAGDPVPLAQNVRMGTLPNGLRYYLLANAKPENRAYLALAVNAGSVLEKDDERGLAHFVEHMAFNGTSHFPERDLINYLRSLGMRFGADVNAHTSYDETVYEIETPVETDGNGVKRVPEKAMQIMDDWTHTVLFNPKDVDEERPIILEERRVHLGAMERIREKMLPILFQGSQYADRRTIGLPEIIENAPAEKLAHFYKTWYRPDNMAIIIAGDFDADALEASLSAYFTAPAPDSPLDRPKFDLEKPKKGRLDVEIFTDSELPYTAAFFYYKRQPKARGATLADYHESLVDYLVSLMLRERFDDQLDKPETPYAGASGYNQRYGFSSRYYVIGVQAKTGSAENAVKAVLFEKEKMERYGFTDAELERAKQETLSALEAQSAEKDRRNSSAYVGDFTNHFLKGEVNPDIEWEFNTAQKLLPRITAKDIADAAKNYFSENDLAVFLLAPESEPLPSADQVKKMVADAKKQRIEKPNSQAVDADLVKNKPAPGAITEETVDNDTGALVWRLSNGARVVLKPTANQNDEIALYAVARGGVTSVKENEIAPARFASDMLSASGAGPFTGSVTLPRSEEPVN